MLKPKKELAKLIIAELKKHYYGNKRDSRELVNRIFMKYDLPAEICNQIVTLKMDPEDIPDNQLFYITDILFEGRINTEYFTDAEISRYSTNKFNSNNEIFPIKWDMAQISSDQWIGKTTIKELMKLRDAQLIFYNENTQRTLIHVEQKDFEYYKIAINKKAVDAILDSYTNNSYIPNTITLNLPEDAEFKYIEGKLIINNTSQLDVIDGYHRYIAMSRMLNINPDFDYPMELRIVCFSQEKAKQFIWQEDQKTKMRKLDSESFNQNNPSNQVISLINQSGIFKGLIGRNSGAIDEGTASNLISLIFFNEKYKSYKRKDIIDVKNLLLEKLNYLIESDPAIFDTRWSYTFTLAAFILFIEETIDGKDLLNKIKSLAEYYDDPKYKSVIGRGGTTLRASILNRAKKLYKEMEG